MVKISIIMPVYNSQNHLKETVESVLNQTFDDFELICIDDESSDDSLKILKEYESIDSRVKIIRQTNKGAGAARNTGLKSSRGEYIFFMDSDDYIVNEFLQSVHNNITSNDSDIVMFKIGNIEKNKKVKNYPYFPFDKTFKDVNFNNFTFNYKQIKRYVLYPYFAPWMKFYRKEFLNHYNDFLFDETLPYEDVLFHVKTMLRASKISFVPNYSYYYRLDTVGSCTSSDETHIEIFKVIEQVGDFLRSENYLDEFEKEYEFFKVEQTTVHISDKNDENYYKKAKSYLKDINIYENDTIPLRIKKRYQVFFDSVDVESYNKNIKIHRLEEEKNKLENTNKKLVNENKKLKNIRDQEKIKKQQLEYSNSWKMTKWLRQATNFIRF